MRCSRLEARIPPVVVTALAAAVMLAIELSTPTRGPARFGPGAVIGSVLAFVGIAVALVGVRAFSGARTTVDPLHPERSVALVTGGIYRISRNPMYLGFVAALLGQALALSSPVGVLLALATAAYLDRFQIAPEERLLQLRFGSDYDEYKRSVRRWI